MSTGTGDFMDDAIETLQAGGTPFAVVVLDYDVGDPADTFKASTRFGDRAACSVRDLRRLRQVIKDNLLPTIEEAIERAEG